MRAPKATSLLDRHATLLEAQHAAEAESQRLAREEEFLAGQVRQAKEQVQYYEELLATLRKEMGQQGPLATLVRRLG
ncbi:MAG TPA: hypothetical protein VKW77_08070 [Acidimicrobiales bacterium]|nr:hypothetical protein [Acidimicrobiales bacterium]